MDRSRSSGLSAAVTGCSLKALVPSRSRQRAGYERRRAPASSSGVAMSVLVAVGVGMVADLAAYGWAGASPWLALVIGVLVAAGVGVALVLAWLPRSSLLRAVICVALGFVISALVILFAPSVVLWSVAGFSIAWWSVCYALYEIDRYHQRGPTDEG